MFIQVWYFLTLTLTSLLMGTSFAHTLEMPAKMKCRRSALAYFSAHALSLLRLRWRTCRDRRDRLLSNFILSGARSSAGFLSNGRRHDFSFPRIFRRLAGITNPVNAETAKWTASSIPPDWSRWRSQWEYSHAARFVLHWIGFSALLISLIRMSSLPSAHHGSV